MIDPVEEEATATSDSTVGDAPQQEVSKRSKRPATPRPFPTITLERTLILATAIKEKNAGNPWPPSEVAKAVGIGEKSSYLDNYTRASVMYGLTSGTRGASQITLEKIGRDIVYAPNPDAELNAKRRAVLNVELFSKVLEYYKGANLPELEFLSNVLVTEFSLAREWHEEFRQIFLSNCEFVQIGDDWRGLETPAAPIRRASNRPETATLVQAYASENNPEGKRCFVIMPFSERLSNRSAGFFDEVFDSLIKPAAEAAGFDVLTANKEGSDVIQSTIVNELIDADLVVADLTDHNPNVLFELGVRLAQEKPVAIIKTSDTGGVFDVDNLLRVFAYSQNLWPSTIKSDIPRLEGHIRAAWEGRTTDRSYISILRSSQAG